MLLAEIVEKNQEIQIETARKTQKLHVCSIFFPLKYR